MYILTGRRGTGRKGSSSSQSQNPYSCSNSTTAADRHKRNEQREIEDLKTTLADIVTCLGQLKVGQQQGTTAAQNAQQAATVAQQAAAPLAPPMPPKKPLPGQLTKFLLLPGEDFRIWLARFESVAEDEFSSVAIPEDEHSNFRWSLSSDPTAAAAVPALAAPIPGNAQNTRTGMGLKQKLLGVFCSDVQKSTATTTLRARVQTESKSAAAFLLGIESLAKAAYDNFEQICDQLWDCRFGTPKHAREHSFYYFAESPDSWDKLKKQAEVVEASLLILIPPKASSLVPKAVNQFEEAKSMNFAAADAYYSDGQFSKIVPTKTILAGIVGPDNPLGEVATNLAVAEARGKPTCMLTWSQSTPKRALLVLICKLQYPVQSNLSSRNKSHSVSHS